MKKDCSKGNQTHSQKDAHPKLMITRLNFLLVVRFSLLFVRCSLLVTFCSLLIARYFLFVARCSLLFARYLFLVAFCPLLVARYFLLVARYFLLVARLLIAYFEIKLLWTAKNCSAITKTLPQIFSLQISEIFVTFSGWWFSKFSQQVFSFTMKELRHRLWKFLNV